MIEPIDNHLDLGVDDPTLKRLIARAKELLQLGWKRDMVHQELSRFNQEECQGALSEEIVEEWSEGTKLLLPVDPPDPVESGQFANIQRIQEATNPLDKAIASRDVKYLYSCIGELAALSPLQYALKKGEIKEGLGKSINLVDLDRAVAAERRKLEGKKTDVADIVLTWCGKQPGIWAYDEGKNVWRMWNGECWQEQYEETSPFDLEAVAAIQEAQVPVNSSSALNLFKRLAPKYLRQSFPHQPHKINFSSGTLNVKTGGLSTFQKEDMLTYCLPYVYNPYGTHPNIDRFFEESIPDLHARQAAIAHIGLSLIGDTCLHKFILALGPPRSGKSTYLKLANAVCGASIAEVHSCAGNSLLNQEIEGKRSREKWNKKRIVCGDEISLEAIRSGEEVLKCMTAHSGVEMRGINRDENTDNRWVPKLILAMNDTPHYKDTSGALGQRAIVVEFPNGPRAEQDQDQTLIETLLLPEIGAFAATCIRYALALLKQKRYPQSAKMRRRLHQISVEGNPLKSFLDDACILDPEARISVADLHSPYAEYCRGGGYSPLARNTMSSALHDMHLGIETKHQRYGPERKLQRVLFGIRLRVSDDPEPEESFQDDVLLSQNGNDVNGQKGTVNGTVTKTDWPLEPKQDSSVTMLTIESSLPSREGYLLHTHTIYTPSIGSNGATKSLTSLQDMVEQPVDASYSSNGASHGSKQTVTDSDETAKHSALKWTEKPCDRCGSHYLQYRSDGHPICVCYQQKKEGD